MVSIILVLLIVRNVSRKDCGFKGHIDKSTWEITDTITSAKFWADILVKATLKKPPPNPSVSASAI